MLGRAWEPLLVKDAKNQLSAHQLHKKEGSGRSLHRAQAETSLRVRLPGALRVMSLPTSVQGERSGLTDRGMEMNTNKKKWGQRKARILAAES